jgi:hypothetical protein
MQIDKQPFSVNTIVLRGMKVLVRPEQADKCTEGSVVVGDPWIIIENTKVSARKVVLDKTLDGQDTIKITIRGAGHGGQAKPPPVGAGQCPQAIPARPVVTTGQAGRGRRLGQ